MKKLLFSFVIFCILLLFSCSLNNQQHYVILRVCEDDKITFSNSMLYTTTDTVFSCEYFLVPDTDKIIDIDSIEIDNPDVLELISVDSSKQIINVRAVNIGVAKIRIKTNSFHSSTSLPINVL